MNSIIRSVSISIAIDIDGLSIDIPSINREGRRRSSREDPSQAGDQTLGKMKKTLNSQKQNNKRALLQHEALC